LTHCQIQNTYITIIETKNNKSQI